MGPLDLFDMVLSGLIEYRWTRRVFLAGCL
jgi:hypothetical protein